MGDFMKIDFKITELLTLPTSIMAALSLACGILLFSPTVFLEKLFMLQFIENYGFVLGLVFVISLSILIINLIYRTAKVISEVKANRDFYARGSAKLKKLSNYQKTIIYGLFMEDSRTAPLPLHDGSILELEQNHMIGKAATQYMVNDLNNAFFPYHLQPWVSGELTDKPDLLSHFHASYLIYSRENENQE